jgi:Putative adhesin
MKRKPKTMNNNMCITLRNALFVLLLSISASFAAEENFSKEVAVAPGGKLVVDVDFGTIQVGAGSDGKVAVEAYRQVEFGNEAKEKEYLAAAPITVIQEGNVVTVRSRRNESWTNWHFGFSRMNATYTLHIPKKFDADLRTSGGEIGAVDISGNLKAHTSGGKLEFANLEGTLKADTSGGSISMENCRCPAEIKTSGGHISVVNGTGILHAKTSGGRIEVHNLSGDADVETSGGSLVLEKIRGKLLGKTSGGSIHTSLPGEVAGDMELRTSAGSIELAVPQNAGLDIDARTSAGRVFSELPIANSESGHQHLRGKLNGGGKSVFLQTSAGSITLKAASSQVAER